MTAGTRTVTHGTSARRVALDALVRVEEGAYSHVLVPQLLRETRLEPRDRAFVTDLVYGTLRAQRRIDWLLQRVSRRPSEQLDPPARAALRLGVYQLIRGVPPHAAVGETVSVTPLSARRYVNGVLRALTRSGPPWPEPKDPATALSCPDWLFELLVRDLGAADAVAMLVASNEPAAVTLRPNLGRTSADGVSAELQAAGVEHESGVLVPDAVVVHRLGDPALAPVIAEGRATPQDQASQAVVAYLAPRPGDWVLDVAAAHRRGRAGRRSRFRDRG